MKVCILTFGSRGDVQPYVALGKALCSAGYEVCVGCDPFYRDLIEAHGLEHRPAGEYITEMHDVIRQLLREPAWRQPIGFTRWVASKLPRILDESMEASRDADLIVSSPAALASDHIAEQRRIPCVTAIVGPPLTRSREAPSGYVPGSRHLPKTLYPASYLLAEQMMWQPFRGPINRWRARNLGLTPLPLLSNRAKRAWNDAPVLYGVSKHVIEPDPSWSDRIQITGNWFLDRDPSWSPPPDLISFLNAGPAPIYFGFGSMVNRDARRFGRIVLEALRMTEQRGVIARGWGGLDTDDVPDTIHVIDALPHDWLFPRMRAVVHHGGAGTTSAGLRAGVPATIIPFWTEQRYWGQRLLDLGVGPAPIQNTRLTPETLAKAIDRMVNDDDMRHRAGSLGDMIQRENGGAVAVEIVSRLLNTRA